MCRCFLPSLLMHDMTGMEELGKREALERGHLLGLVHKNAYEGGKANEKKLHALIC